MKICANLILASRQGFGELKTEQLGGHSQEQQRHRQAPIDIPLQKCRTSVEVFYINICGFISRYKFLYETRVLNNSYLRFEVQLPTSDSTQITAGGPKVPIDTCTPRRP